MHVTSIRTWCNFLRIILSRLFELTFFHFIKTNIFNIFYISKVDCFYKKFQYILVIWINRFGHVSKLDESFFQIVFLFTFYPSIKKGSFDTVSHPINAWKYGNALQTSIVKCCINDQILYNVGFGISSLNSINRYLIPVLLLCKQTSSIIRTILSINCFFIKESIRLWYNEEHFE